MEKPNGLAFSPDESLLYVSDTSAAENPQQLHDIHVYEVKENRYVENRRVFATIEPGEPDGFHVDIHGNIFTSSADSVQVYALTVLAWAKFSYQNYVPILLLAVGRKIACYYG